MMDEEVVDYTKIQLPNDWWKQCKTSGESVLRARSDPAHTLNALLTCWSDRYISAVCIITAERCITMIK
jgi:hypothetical protein